MITKKEFYEAICSGKPLIYHYGFGENCQIEPLHITKTKGHLFWFEARIINNDNMSNYNKIGFYKVDNTIHSFSNSFIYTDGQDLLKGQVKEKQAQIKFLQSL